MAVVLDLDSDIETTESEIAAAMQEAELAESEQPSDGSPSPDVGDAGEIAAGIPDGAPAPEAPIADPPATAEDLAALRREVEQLSERLTQREKFEAEIADLSRGVEAAAAEVLAAESDVEEAKGELKGAKERYDRAVNELRALTRDAATGQGRLFSAAAAQTVTVAAFKTENGVPVTITMEKPPASSVAAPVVDVVDIGGDMPVGMLGAKELKKLVGAEEFDRAKNSEEPIGLTDKQVAAIEGQDCLTVADLERKLRDRPLFLIDLPGFGEKAQNRLTASLMAFRTVHRMPVDVEPESETEGGGE